MSGFKTWKVLPEDGGWVVSCLDERRFESRHDRKNVAVDEAKRLAIENRPGQVVIHDRSGDVVAAVHYNGLDREPATNEGPRVSRA